MMINSDLEMPLDERWVSSCNFMKDGYHPFIIGGFSQFVVTSEIQGTPFLHQYYTNIST
jgi:hypothetical protein